jgi:hypothetical protein
VTEELGPGICEALVTEGLRAQLDALADATPATTRALASAEAPDRIAWHLSRQIERALNDVTDADADRGVEIGQRPCCPTTSEPGK